MDSILDSLEGYIKNENGITPSRATEFYLQPIEGEAPEPDQE